jgi:hypothetical protein
MGQQLRSINPGAVADFGARSFPPRGWIGLLLIAIFWPLNWMLPGLRTAYLFFPLWLGYVLLIDTVVEHRGGTSLWTRSRKDFIFLFFLSAPAWWLFEWMNKRLGNWEYLGGQHFSDLEYFFLSTISFSTVMPAVFETAEFVRTFRWTDRRGNGLRIPNTASIQFAILLSGLAMLALMLIWPRYFYPFAWSSIVFILEPINHRLGHPHFLQDLERGDWRKIISLAFGSLICGFFWEMWNFYSYPKWIYHTPGAEFLHIFEMPLLGYGGYIPFALELCALKDLIWPKGIRLRL